MGSSCQAKLAGMPSTVVRSAFLNLAAWPCPGISGHRQPVR